MLHAKQKQMYNKCKRGERESKKEFFKHLTRKISILECYKYCTIAFRYYGIWNSDSPNVSLFWSSGPSPIEEVDQDNSH